MKTTPIQLDLAQGDTQPVLTWTIKNADGSVKDITPATISVTLYYMDAEADPGAAALWKKLLTKSGFADGKGSFTTDSTHKFYPDPLAGTAGGTKQFVGWLKYIDTSDGTNKWIKDALRVTAEQMPAEPV